MASKLGVTALYVTPTQESGGAFDPPDSPGSPPLEQANQACHFELDALPPIGSNTPTGVCAGAEALHANTVARHRFCDLETTVAY